MNSYTIFPEVVTTSEIHNIPKSLLKCATVRSVVRPNEGNLASVDTYILDNPEYSILKKDIELLLSQHLIMNYNATDNVHIYITQSWLNYTDTGGYHHEHFHPNSVFSGVLYLQTGLLDSITLCRREEPLILHIPNTGYSDINSTTHTISDLYEGKIVIFSSKLRHKVAEVFESTPRVSLSFNTFIRGVLGTEEDLTELPL